MNVYNIDSIAILVISRIFDNIYIIAFFLLISLIVSVDLGGYVDSIVLKQELERNFKGYRSLTKKQRAFLNGIGCSVSRQRNHVVLAVPVIRYEKKYANVTIPCTSSDSRCGMNIAMKIYNTMVIQ